MGTGGPRRACAGGGHAQFEVGRKAKGTLCMAGVKCAWGIVDRVLWLSTWQAQNFEAGQSEATPDEPPSHGRAATSIFLAPTTAGASRSD
jgi:hypothetical protein